MPDKSWCKKAKVFLKPGMICDILENIVFDGFTAAARGVTAKYMPPVPRKRDYTVD